MIDSLLDYFNIKSTLDLIWLTVGLGAQLMFSMRFLVQWITSKIKRESVVPVSFWFLSIGGSLILLMYAIHRRDPVFILGQSLGCLIYARNLMMIRRREQARGP